MTVKKVERLYFSDTDWKNWDTFKELVAEVKFISDEDDKLFETMLDIQDAMKDIENEFIGDD